MSAEKSEKDFLVETLVEAGVTPSVARNAKIMSWAKDDPQENKRVHAATNSLLLDLLRKDDLGKCIHVTGGARALTDPFHRHVCEAMRLDHREPFQVLYHVPNNVARDGWGVVAWNLKKWGDKGFDDWRQKLRTLKMIGKKAVDLKAYDERSRIQFSVFGKQYAQVQGRHDDEASAKYVWLIHSEKAYEQLTESAESDLSKSAEVEERAFSDIVTSIFSNSSRAILNMIAQGDATTREDILEDDFLGVIDPNPDSTLEALKIMSFLESDPLEKFKLTDDGAAFLKAS